MAFVRALRARLVPVLQIAALLPFWAAGVGLARVLPLPLPGTVLGMALLLAALHLGWVKPEWFEAGAELLFRHMLLFFVPAAVGVVAYPELAGARGARVVGVIAVSTVLVMVVTGAVADAVAARRRYRR